MIAKVAFIHVSIFKEKGAFPFIESKFHYKYSRTMTNL